jgi:hypothetical protein
MQDSECDVSTAPIPIPLCRKLSWANPSITRPQIHCSNNTVLICFRILIFLWDDVQRLCWCYSASVFNNIYTAKPFHITAKYPNKTTLRFVTLLYFNYRPWTGLHTALPVISVTLLLLLLQSYVCMHIYTVRPFTVVRMNFYHNFTF